MSQYQIQSDQPAGHVNGLLCPSLKTIQSDSYDQ